MKNLDCVDSITTTTIGLRAKTEKKPRDGVSQNEKTKRNTNLKRINEKSSHRRADERKPG